MTSATKRSVSREPVPLPMLINVTLNLAANLAISAID